MGVLHLKKCLLLCRAHSYIALRVLLCISPWSGSGRSPSLFLAGFSPFILAHVIWKKNFITCGIKKEGPGGVRQVAAVKRGRSFMFLIRDFATAVLYAALEVSDVRRWIVTKISPPPSLPLAFCETESYANFVSFYTQCSYSSVQYLTPEHCLPVAQSNLLRFSAASQRHDRQRSALTWALCLVAAAPASADAGWNYAWTFLRNCQEDVSDAGHKF